MKVLLCSPYIQSSEIVSGGINIWANNLISYQSTKMSDVELVPISFDRKSYVSASTNIISRIFFGAKDLTSSVVTAKKRLSNHDIDVIHICTSASYSLTKDIALLRAANNAGVRSIIHFHFGRIPELITKNNWEWKLIRKCLNLTSCAITMDMKSYCALRNKGFNNVVHCPNPLSHSIINQINAEIRSIERIDRRILFVGHVLPTKGVYELVQACKDIHNIELHIVGRAEDRIKEELLSIAQNKKECEWLKFRGEIPHTEVLQEMMKASVFVLPSYTEGFPNVILEAMACGCPIVSTTVGAIPEMLDINNGPNYGICVEPQDVNALRNSINVFLNDKKYALETSKRAMDRVNNLYSIPKVWEQLVKIWRSA